MLTSFDDNPVLLSSIVKQSPIYIARFSEDNCHVCIDSLIMSLKSRLINQYSNNRIVLLLSFKNKRGLIIFKEQFQLYDNIYSIDPYSLYLDSIEVPYIFKLDSTLVPQSIFLPYISIPELTDDYFDYIEKHFWWIRYKIHQVLSKI